ncbi:Homeobox protein extradenticle [Fasciola hepatica]|uniref:Homeobox protein extradenticle n=1 Tax=Fasciola hepatica TaxID=6192 RepID=A0A4E0RFG0_FASHE|nr:Homeobox protein extradenticle [Fasciola hepatica]
MENLHDPVIRQCITSVALNNNILKHNSCDNFCVIKSDHPLANQTSKTVSLVLTRLPQPPTTYVHVLRCNACGFLTLNTASLKEHIRNNHPTSQGFWTYSCYQCSSMSTEKFLMEEHLKLYHRASDVSNGKLIERFHGPTSVDIVQNTTGTPIPFTLTPSNASPSAGFTLNLVNAINAIQNANKMQGLSGLASLSKTTPPLSVSSPHPATSVMMDLPKEDLSLSEKTVESSTEMKGEDLPFPTSADLSSSSIVSTSTVSGSRRRKATTPGRIRVQPSADASEPHSDDDAHISVADESTVKSCESPADRDSSKEAVMDSVTSAPNNKRSPAEQEMWSDAISDYPSPKRSRVSEISQEVAESIPRNSGTFVTDCNQTKSSIQQTLPFILSIGNPSNPQPASQTSTITACPQPLNSAATTSVSSSTPFIGQLIPLCGLSDSLLCSVSSALLANGTNSAAPGLTAHSLIGNALSVPVIDAQTAFSTPTTGSTWLLTSQPNALAAHMTNATGHLSQLQSTVIVPVPATFGAEQLLGSAAKQLSTLSVDSNGDVTNFNSTVPCSTSGHSNTNSTTTTINTGINTTPGSSNFHNLRVSDVLEALKSFAASGNLAASISLPVAGTSTSPATSAVANSCPVSTRFTVPSQPRSDLVSVPSISKTSPITLGTTVDNSSGVTLIGGCSSTNSTINNNNNSGISLTTQLTAGKQVVTASGLLNQLAIAAAAVNVPSSEQGNSAMEPLNVINGLTTAVIPAGNHEQALDMSVRSGLISLNALAPLGSGAWLNKSTENNSNSPHLTLALDTVDGKPVRSDQTTAMHGVMEALNAALKGSLQKPTKLTRITEGPTKCESSGENDQTLLEAASHLTSGSVKVHTAKVDQDPVLASSGLLKTSSTGTQSILLPFPALSLPSTDCNTPEMMNDSESGRSSVSQLQPTTLTAAHQLQQQLQSNTTTVTNQSVSTNSPMLVSPAQSQLVNWAQLQAIMAALAAGGTMTVPPQTTAGNTSILSGTTVSSTSMPLPPGSLVQTGPAHTPSGSSSSGESSSGLTTLLGTNPVLMSHHPVSTATATSHSTGFETNSSSTTLLPTLNSLTSVCGLTLTTNPAGQSNTGSRVGNVVSSTITGGTPSVSMCVTQSPATTFKSISLPSTDGLSFANILTGAHSGSQTGTFNPTLIGNSAFINLVSNRSPSQTSVALSPAAAARLLSGLTGLAPSASTGSSASNLLITTATAASTGSNTNPSNATITTNSAMANVPTASATGSVASVMANPSSTAVQLSSATGLVNGTLNVLDSNSQALLAAAAASGHMNHVTLANLRGSHGSTGLRPLGTAPNGPVIGLLDPRTGLQFNVATTTSALLATPELVNCLQRGVFTSHNTDDHSFVTVRSTDAPATVAGSTTVVSVTPTTTVNTMASAEGNTSGTNSLLRMGKKSSEMDSVSPYDSHGIDDEWEALGPSDDSVAVQVNLQSIYAGMKSDPTSSSPLPCLNSSNLLSTSGAVSASTRRHASSSRGSGLTSSNRRNLNTSGDSSGAHHGRPHRQNFTPTQNRILTEWYSKHKAKPYPSTDDTKELATISGLSYSQVKKWFANKRARSSSIGLPKPTPPLAPDSSPDPSAAKAIVAAAMAAATSSSQSTPGLDSSVRQIQLQPAFVITPHALNSVTASVTESSTEVDENEPETPLEPVDGDEDGGITASQTSPHAISCINDAATFHSVSTEDEDVPLIVVSEMSAPNVLSTNKDISTAQMDEVSTNNEVKCDTPKSNIAPHVSSDDVTALGLGPENALQSISLTLESPVSSPPTLEVPLKSSVTSPINGFLSENSPTAQVTAEESLSKKTEELEMNRTVCEEHATPLKSSKNLRTRGVIIHAS